MNRPSPPALVAFGRPISKLVSSLARRLPWLVLGIGLSACGGGAPSIPSQIPSGAALHRYDLEAARLFDEVIDPNAVGLLVSSSSSRLGKLLLHERTQMAHVVTRVRVQTVTADLINGVPVYHLVLAPIGDPLGLAELPQHRAEIDVGPQTPAFGIVKSFDARLIGRSFVGFFRWFQTDDEPRLYWHLTADDPEVIATIREAALELPKR